MKKLVLKAAVHNIKTVTDFVNNELEFCNCPLKAKIQIDVAIDEIFSNISRYAYEDEEGDAIVTIDVKEDPLRVIISFSDNGKPFNPLAKENPDTSLSAKERPIGGLGIFMVKKSMDAIDYKYSNGQNILTIKKDI